MSQDSRPGPAEYGLIFEDHRIGAAILEDLVQRFGGDTYVRGGLEAQRQSDYNAGARSVVTFLLRRLNQAHGQEPIDPVSNMQGDDDAA